MLRLRGSPLCVPPEPFVSLRISERCWIDESTTSLAILESSALSIKYGPRVTLVASRQPEELLELLELVDLLEVVVLVELLKVLEPFPHPVRNALRTPSAPLAKIVLPTLTTFRRLMPFTIHPCVHPFARCRRYSLPVGLPVYFSLMNPRYGPIQSLLS